MSWDAIIAKNEQFDLPLGPSNHIHKIFRALSTKFNTEHYLSAELYTDKYYIGLSLSHDQTEARKKAKIDVDKEKAKRKVSDSESMHLFCERTNYYTELNKFTEKDNIHLINLCVRGGNPIDDLVKICLDNDWILFDMQTAESIDLNNPSHKSWEQFSELHDRVATSKSMEDIEANSTLHSIVWDSTFFLNWINSYGFDSWEIDDYKIPEEVQLEAVFTFAKSVILNLYIILQNEIKRRSITDLKTPADDEDILYAHKTIEKHYSIKEMREVIFYKMCELPNDINQIESLVSKLDNDLLLKLFQDSRVLIENNDSLQ